MLHQTCKTSTFYLNNCNNKSSPPAQPAGQDNVVIKNKDNVLISCLNILI
jgi:hypothetical protein